MRHHLTLRAVAVLAVSALVVPALSLAQGMPSERLADGAVSAAGGVDHTAREEREGQAVWEKLQTKQVTCGDLSDDDFGAVGEFFMGRMHGSSHAAMNTMMAAMMGEAGEEQTHVVMGKRLSGCDPAAAFSESASGFLPMMQMMGSGRGWHPASTEGVGTVGSGWRGSNFFAKGGENGMMYGNYGAWGAMGLLGPIIMALFWVLTIVALVAFVRWLWSQGASGGPGSARALGILKGRYAKGEIGKEEYEATKRDLVS